MAVQRARTPEEYVDWVNQAIYEIEELRLSAEYDMEDMGASLRFVDELEKRVRELHAAMEAGSYAFANQDLAFMELVDKYDADALPFRYLLRQINETHRKGLDVEDT